MAHLQYMPGDPRLVDQLVCELKSKGIFDQFRKDCIADVDTRPAYQNLRQRVESSVTTFLSRQCWQPDLNKNQLREKLRKHILDGNYLEQGVERIVDQVVNPKVATVFIPQVEDLVYNYLGITRKKSAKVETANGKVDKEDLLPTDLEAVSPGSVKSNEEKGELMDTEDFKDETKMDVDEDIKEEVKEETLNPELDKEKDNVDTQLSSVSELTENELDTIVEKSDIPLPDEIKLEDIPLPEDSPPMIDSKNIDVDKIPLPDDLDLASIPMPKDEMDVKEEKFKPILNSEEDDSSSDSSLRRNMSPLTPIRNYNNENSCDAQQGFENDSDDAKKVDEKDTSSFRFHIDSKSSKSSPDTKTDVEKKDPEQANLSYQFNNQVNIQKANNFPTPTFDDSSNSHNLQIDYESDANSKLNNPEVKQEVKAEEKIQEEVKKEVKPEERKSSHKSSHRSRDSHRHSSSSKDKSSRRSDSKYSSSRDKESKDRKSSKEDSSKKREEERKSQRERSKDRSDKKDSRDSSKHSSSHRSSSHKDPKSHRSSSSSQQKSSRHSDDKKSSSSSSSREKSSKTDKSSDRSSKDYKSSRDSSSKSHKSDRDRDRKSSSSSKSKNEEKEKEKKEKKETDDHYGLSGRGSNSRRSTDRDSNDGSSSSKGSNNQTNSKTSDSKRENKSSSKSENTSTSSDNTSPSDKDIVQNEDKNDKANTLQTKPIVRIDTHLELPRATPPRLPFVPDVTIKKPKFAANMEEARQLIKMRKFLDDEQKRMNQEAALLLEFQANVRPSLSQVYSNIPGPEMEFACVKTPTEIENTKDFVDDEKDKKAKSDLQESIENIQNHIMETDGGVDTNTTEPNLDTGPQRNKFVPQNTESLQEMLSQETSANSNGKKEEIDKLKAKEIKGIKMLPDKIIYVPETIEREITKEDQKQEFEITIVTEELSESEDIKDEVRTAKTNETLKHPDESPLKYFDERETQSAELELKKHSDFLKRFIEKSVCDDKIYLVNCNSYQENVIKEASKGFGDYEIVNIHQNGYLKLNKNVIKNLNISTEVTLPVDKEIVSTEVLFSPAKSECSFELSSDYNSRLEEMVKKTSRKEIMEIILGGGLPDEMQIEMPTINYCNIETEDVAMKRKMTDEDCGENNNQRVLTPNKIRKLSNSDQISSTTEEGDQTPSDKAPKVIRSKYLGKAKRVGLPRPKKTNLPNSPSSDKSVENYEQNAQSPSAPNGKLKLRNKVQRYDTSDLYKPKLHFLSRRNNISSQN